MYIIIIINIDCCVLSSLCLDVLLLCAKCRGVIDGCCCLVIHANQGEC